MSTLDAILLAIPPLLGISVWVITDDDPSPRRRFWTTSIITVAAAIGVAMLRAYVILPGLG